MRLLRWSDRRHWTVELGRLWVERWCPGAPCSLPGVRHRRHPVTAGLYRRSWARRYDDPPVNGFENR